MKIESYRRTSKSRLNGSINQNNSQPLNGLRKSRTKAYLRCVLSAGLIKYARGKIQIVDAEALQDGACECYETVKRHYARLLGPAK